jgi:hypothetical protein
MPRHSEPKTLQQAILFFADYANCHKAVMEIRWPDGPFLVARNDLAN